MLRCKYLPGDVCRDPNESPHRIWLRSGYLRVEELRKLLQSASSVRARQSSATSSGLPLGSSPRPVRRVGQRSTRASVSATRSLQTWSVGNDVRTEGSPRSARTPVQARSGMQPPRRMPETAPFTAVPGYETRGHTTWAVDVAVRRANCSPQSRQLLSSIQSSR